MHAQRIGCHQPDPRSTSEYFHYDRSVPVKSLSFCLTSMLWGRRRRRHRRRRHLSPPPNCRYPANHPAHDEARKSWYCRWGRRCGSAPLRVQTSILGVDGIVFHVSRLSPQTPVRDASFRRTGVRHDEILDVRRSRSFVGRTSGGDSRRMLLLRGEGSDLQNPQFYVRSSHLHLSESTAHSCRLLTLTNVAFQAIPGSDERR